MIKNYLSLHHVMNFGRVLVFHSVLLFSLISVISSQEFRLAFLKLINYYRHLHGSENLILKEKINQIAEAQANSYCKQKRKRYIPIEEPHSFTNLTCHSYKPLDCIHQWYQEGANYDYDHSQFELSGSNFTNMIWKSSMYIGIGICMDSNELFHVVAKIYPPGNEVGLFHENVLNTTDQCSILTTDYFVSAITVIILLFIEMYIV